MDAQFDKLPATDAMIHGFLRSIRKAVKWGDAFGSNGIHHLSPEFFHQEIRIVEPPFFEAFGRVTRPAAPRKRGDRVDHRAKWMGPMFHQQYFTGSLPETQLSDGRLSRQTAGVEAISHKHCELLVLLFSTNCTFGRCFRWFNPSMVWGSAQPGVHRLARCRGQSPPCIFHCGNARPLWRPGSAR